MTSRSAAVALTAAVLALCAGCGSSTPSAGPSGSPTGSPSASPSAVVPTRSQVAAAMLSAADVPAGYKQSPSSNDSGVTGSGPNASCRDLATIVFGTKLPGALFEVDRSFDKADGNSISESVAPFSTVAAASAMAKRIGDDVAGCPKLVATSGGKSITFALSVAAAPSAGEQGTAVTMTGTGPLAGLVITNTTIRYGSTLIGLSAPTPADADRLTTLALERLKPVLGASA